MQSELHGGHVFANLRALRLSGLSTVKRCCQLLAFTMTYYDEISMHDACAALGISAETFKARVLRARQHPFHRLEHSLVPLRAEDCALHSSQQKNFL